MIKSWARLPKTQINHIEQQSRRAVAVLPYIDNMSQLWELPEDTYFVANDRVWTRDEYLLAQAMSSARNGELFTGRAKVLCLPLPHPGGGA